MADHAKGGLVVQRQIGEVNLHAATPLVDEFDGPGEHCQGLQTKEIELHQARAFHGFHVETGDRHVRAGIAVKGDQFAQRPVADDHPGGVGGSVAVQALQLAGDADQAGNAFIVLDHPAEQGLPGDGLVQCERIGRIIGDQLADAVHLGIGNFQDPAHVAQHGACLELAEGDDLGHPVAAVFLLDVAEDLVSPVLAKVHVEIGHGDALGIQEPLEQEPEAQRIQVGDGQGPGDDGTGAGPAPRPHGNPVLLGPADEVGDDQEVAREPHVHDDVELVVQAVPVGLVRVPMAVRGPPLRQPPVQAGPGLGAELVLLAPALAAVVGRQDGLAALHHEGAAPGDDHGVVHGLGQVLEEGPHLGRALEVVFRRQPAALLIRDQGAVRDADQGVVGLEHAGIGEMAVVGGDDRQVEAVGKVQQRRLYTGLDLQPVAHDLHVDAPGKGRRQAHRQGFGSVLASLCQLPAEGPVCAAREHDQAVPMSRQGVHGHSLGALALEIGGGEQVQHVTVTGFVLDQDGEGALVVGADPQLAADDGLHPGFRRSGRELHGAEEVVGVGDRHRGHLQFPAERRQAGDVNGSLQKGIGRMGRGGGRNRRWPWPRIPQAHLGVTKM